MRRTSRSSSRGRCSGRRGRSPRSSRERVAGARRRRGGRGRRARLPQPDCRRRLARRRPRGGARGGRRLRRRLAPTSPSASRWSSSPPTRPARSPSPRPGTAPTATRSRGCSRSPATRSSASTTTTTQAPRWTSSAPPSRRCAAARSLRRTATAAPTSRSSRSVEGDPVPRMLEEIEASLERFRIHFDTLRAAERRRGGDARGDRAARHLRGGRRRLGPDDAPTATTRTASSSARTATPTYFAVDAAYVRRKYARGFDRLVYVLGADHHGYVARLQALAEMLGPPARARSRC